MRILALIAALLLCANTALAQNIQPSGGGGGGGGSGCIPAGSATDVLTDSGSGTCNSDSRATLVNGAMTLGASGVAGSVTMGNATSGTLKVQPVTGALGTPTLSLPAVTDTVAVLGTAQTWTAVQTFNANDFKLGGVTGSTQCLHADTTGVVTGTGSDCGSGGGLTVGTTTITSGTNGQFLYDNSGVLGNQTAVTSVGTGCGASGGTITTTGTLKTQESITARTSGNYSTTDCGTIVNYNSATDQTPTLPSASSMGAGGYFDTCSIQHTQTLTPNSGIPDTIGGASTYLLRTGTAALPTCVRLIADGTSNWAVVPYQGASLQFVQPVETAVALSGCNGSTATMDLTKGSYFDCTVSTGAVTFAVSNPAASGLVSSFTLELTNGGSQTLTWMSGTKWPGGSAPALTASGVDLLVCSTRDAATTWRCVGSEINSH